ncbi:MAG: dicarboxylate/amino acid:cation symporter [Lentisphaeria bacterium]|nr:dicarboxylate/amino acid:cation symporter [Lentisphaeria bacterium]
MGFLRNTTRPVRIMIGMGIGIVIGILCNLFLNPETVQDFFLVRLFEIGGNLFLNLFKMIVVPVVLVSVTLGVVSMNRPELLGRIGGKTLFWFAFTTLLSAAMGIFFATVFKIGHGTTISLPQDAGLKLSGKVHSISETLANLVPSNLFQAIVESNMLQIIVIALILGISLAKISAQVPNLRIFLKEVDALNLSVVNLILDLAPIGVFCLLAHTFSCFGFRVLFPLSKYIFCFLGVSALLMFLVYPALLMLFAKISPVKFYQNMLPVMLLAFSTSSSNAVLPANINTICTKIGVSKNIATFILSLGATINMNGTAIMQCCATVLIAQLYNIPLSLVQIIEIISMTLIASIGTAGMPSAGILMLGLVLQSAGLPISGIALVLGVDRIVDMFRTVVNITGDAVTAVLVGSSEKELDREVLNR